MNCYPHTPLRLLFVLTIAILSISSINASCLYKDGVKVSETKIGILLKWTCLEEFDNDHFLIQRSDDGSFYYTIGKVVSAPSPENNSYSFLDSTPGQNATWYRIKSMDKQGKLENGPSTKVERQIPNRMVVTKISEPVVERFVQAELYSAVSGLVKYEIRNMQMEKTYEGIFHVFKGVSHISIPMEALEDGIYYVMIIMDEEKEQLIIEKRKSALRTNVRPEKLSE